MLYQLSYPGTADRRGRKRAFSRWSPALSTPSSPSSARPGRAGMPIAVAEPLQQVAVAAAARAERADAAASAGLPQIGQVAVARRHHLVSRMVRDAGAPGEFGAPAGGRRDGRALRRQADRWRAPRRAGCVRGWRSSGAGGAPAGSARSSSGSEARGRGRTIWRKPKPLTAVRSNGGGSAASIAAATGLARAPCRPASGNRCRSSRRCRGGGSPGRTAVAAAMRERVERRVAVDVEQRHRRGRRHAQRAAGEGDLAGRRLVEQLGPAGRLERVGLVRAERADGDGRWPRCGRAGRGRAAAASRR